MFGSAERANQFKHLDSSLSVLMGMDTKAFAISIRTRKYFSSFSALGYKDNRLPFIENIEFFRGQLAEKGAENRP